jgi:hypothetical protein
MRQILIDGRLMDVVVIGESDEPSDAGPSSGNPNVANGTVSSSAVPADCPPEVGADTSPEARAWQERLRDTREGLIRSANAWQAIRDAENDAQLAEDEEAEEDDDEGESVDELEVVAEQAEDDEDEEGELESEGTESGEEMNDDGGVPLRGWSMLDVDGQRARSRSRSRSRNRSGSPARGRDHTSRDRTSLLRGSFRYASPQRGRAASCDRQTEEEERDNERVATWRYWKKFADEWQATEPPITSGSGLDGPTSARSQTVIDRARALVTSQTRGRQEVIPGPYGY